MHGIGGIALYGNVRCPGRGHEIAESHDIATPPLIAHKPMSGTMIPLVLKRRAAGSADLERSAPPATHVGVVERAQLGASYNIHLHTYSLTRRHTRDHTLSLVRTFDSVITQTPHTSTNLARLSQRDLHTTPQHVGAASAGLRRVCARTIVPSFRVYAFTCTSP